MAHNNNVNDTWHKITMLMTHGTK